MRVQSAKKIMESLFGDVMDIARYHLLIAAWDYLVASPPR